MSNMKCPNIKIYKCSDGFVTDNAQVAKSHEANIKSNKLICPFCQQELDYLAEDIYGSRVCPNCHCLGWVLHGNDSMWQELIRTRKALEIAVDALKLFCGEDVSYYNQSKIDARDARTALEQITALEQKDVK